MNPILIRINFPFGSYLYPRQIKTTYSDIPIASVYGGIRILPGVGIYR